jgi:hypothetical protein
LIRLVFFIAVNSVPTEQVTITSSIIKDDPVELGGQYHDFLRWHPPLLRHVVTSLARPGGNLTGINFVNDEIIGQIRGEFFERAISKEVTRLWA